MINENRFASVLGNKKFSKEMLPKLQKIIIDLIEKRNVNVFETGSDDVNERIYLLFHKLNRWYPEISFTVYVTRLETVFKQDCSEPFEHRIFALDHEILNDDPKIAGRLRNKKLIWGADIIICPADSKLNDIEKLRKMSGNPTIELITIS